MLHCVNNQTEVMMKCICIPFKNLISNCLNCFNVLSCFNDALFIRCRSFFLSFSYHLTRTYLLLVRFFHDIGTCPLVRPGTIFHRRGGHCAPNEVTHSTKLAGASNWNSSSRWIVSKTKCIVCIILVTVRFWSLGPRLLTWINFNLCLDKSSHTR